MTSGHEHGDGDASLGAGGLGVVSTPRDSTETGGGRVYALKMSSRAGIPLASRPLSTPSHLDAQPTTENPVAGACRAAASDGRDSAGCEASWVEKADARDSARRPSAREAALLSMGHIATPQQPLLRIWADGSRVDVPRGESPIPLPPRSDEPPPLRGTITDFSDKSRRRLQRELATRRRDALSYTMALTLPGDFSHLPAETVIAHFRVLQRRFTRTWASKGVSLDWKRELQKRMALHYHLLLYGLDDSELRESVRGWFVSQWNSLCCSGMSDQEREKHRWWHARDENLQQVKDIAGYFAKYLGKEEDASGALPGRWWGSWNKDALPISETEEVALPSKALAMIRRIARKLRQNRANEAKHQAIVKKLEIRQISRFQLDCMRMGYTLQGFRPHCYVTEDGHCRLSGQEIAACFDDGARAHGLRFGKASTKPKRRGKAHLPQQSTAPIVLLGRHTPDSMRRAVEWVSFTLGIPLELQNETSHQSREILPLRPPPGYARRPRRQLVPVQLDLIPMERIRPSAPGYNQIEDGGKNCPSRGRIGGRLSCLPA
jgi:hypothetical protein